LASFNEYLSLKEDGEGEVEVEIESEGDGDGDGLTEAGGVGNSSKLLEIEFLERGEVGKVLK